MRNIWIFLEETFKAPQLRGFSTPNLKVIFKYFLNKYYGLFNQKVINKITLA
jgi:hypothetical protein